MAAPEEKKQPPPDEDRIAQNEKSMRAVFGSAERVVKVVLADGSEAEFRLVAPTAIAAVAIAAEYKDDKADRLGLALLEACLGHKVPAQWQNNEKAWNELLSASFYLCGFPEAAEAFEAVAKEVDEDDRLTEAEQHDGVTISKTAKQLRAESKRKGKDPDPPTQSG